MICLIQYLGCDSLVHVASRSGRGHVCTFFNRLPVDVKDETSRVVFYADCDLCGQKIDSKRTLKCSECGIDNVCDDCVESLGERLLCKKCIRDKGWSCDLCDNKYVAWCQCCGARSCYDHIDGFDFIPRNAFDEINKLHYSLYCPKCRGYVCNKCYITIERKLRGTVEHCKRCGTRLIRHHPLATINQEHWKQIFPNKKNFNSARGWLP